MSREKSKISSPADPGARDIGVAHVESDLPGGGATVTIEGLASDGRGVGRHDGLVWFVESAVPGDVVEAVGAVRRRSYVEAVAGRVLEPGPDRREPPCPVQSRCGGCPWMPLGEDAQRRWKRRIVIDALRRLGRFDAPPVSEVRGSPLATGYRNRVEFHLGRGGDGEPVAGLHGRRPGVAVDVERCLLQTSPAARAWAAIRELLAEAGEDRDRWWRDAGEPVRVVVRSSSIDGRVLVGFRAVGPLAGERDRARALVAAVPEVVGVVRIEPRPGRRGGARERVLAGHGTLDDRFLGTTFALPAGAFLQVNPGAAEILGAAVLEASAGFGPGDRLLDLYGGVGGYAWALARSGLEAEVVEASAEAVRAGREGRTEAGGRRPRFHRADVRSWLESVPDGTRFDLVVANPPRTGMGRGVPETIARRAPRRVVVVSCDAATLARDLRRFSDAGYVVRRVVPIDLFPQTPHVETVTILEPEDAEAS